jgi:hypothetical protein
LCTAGSIGAMHNSLIEGESMIFDVNGEVDRYLRERGIGGLSGVRDEVDRYLRERGISGLSEIGKTLERAVAEGRVREGPFESAEWALHEGYWLIAEDLTPKRKQYALIWLACAELGVPLALRERFAQEAEREIGSNTK